MTLLDGKIAIVTGAGRGRPSARRAHARRPFRHPMEQGHRIGELLELLRE